MFDNLITIITTTDPRFVIGWALIFYGLGVVTVALFWAREKSHIKQLAEVVIEMVTDPSGLGHAIAYHEFDGLKHAHCICDERSLNYQSDDPTAERLMEQWAEHHIDSLMESAGR